MENKTKQKRDGEHERERKLNFVVLFDSLIVK